jgi:hypothetical protein
LILPLFEAAVEGFIWIHLEFGLLIRFEVVHGWETHPLEAHFYSREQQKVTQREIWREQQLGDDRNAFLSEELLHNK